MNVIFLLTNFQIALVDILDLYIEIEEHNYITFKNCIILNY